MIEGVRSTGLPAEMSSRVAFHSVSVTRWTDDATASIVPSSAVPESEIQRSHDSAPRCHPLDICEDGVEGRWHGHSSASSHLELDRIVG